MAKKTKGRDIFKKVIAWIFLLAMILSIFAYAFSVFAK